MPVMSIDELQAFLDREFPQIKPLNLRIEAVDDGRVRLRLPFDERHLRPGGTLSGPSMMTLADCAMYVVVLAMAGPVGQAVTTNLNINFLRRPEPRDLIGEARLLKLGRRLAVGEVGIYSEGLAEPVAHATLTYSIPDRAEGVR